MLKQVQHDSKKGFTLIELLVVVLIIGILSAIALPQYQEAVEKARAAEALVVAKALVDAAERYEQANPNDCVSNKNQIADVDLKGGKWKSDGTQYITKNFIYQLDLCTSRQAVDIYRKDTANPASATDADFALSGWLYNVEYRPNGTFYCKSADNDTENLCKFFEALYKKQ